MVLNDNSSIFVKTILVLFIKSAKIYQKMLLHVPKLRVITFFLVLYVTTLLIVHISLNCFRRHWFRLTFFRIASLFCLYGILTFNVSNPGKECNAKTKT